VGNFKRVFLETWKSTLMLFLHGPLQLDLCNQKCLLRICWPRKPRVISNQVFDISHRNAFIAILVPKLVAMVAPLCPLCTEVSQMNLQITQTLCQNQILHGYVAYDWSNGHFLRDFCLFWPKFGYHVNVPKTLAITNVFCGLVYSKNHTIEPKNCQ